MTILRFILVENPVLLQGDQCKVNIKSNACIYGLLSGICSFRLLKGQTREEPSLFFTEISSHSIMKSLNKDYIYGCSNAAYLDFKITKAA